MSDFRTVQECAVHIICNEHGLTNKEIAKKVRDIMDSQTSRSCIAWYKRMIRNGEIPVSKECFAKLTNKNNAHIGIKQLNRNSLESIPSEGNLFLANLETLKSSYYEKVVEITFLAELLQESLFRFGKEIDVLRPEVDNAGYDIVLDCNGITRHIQLKTSRPDSKTAKQKVNIALAHKPSGCILWIQRTVHNNRIKLNYLFYGGHPGEPLPSLDKFKTAKHSKANALGEKKERPDFREVPKGCFINIKNTELLLEKLFGNKDGRDS